MFIILKHFSLHTAPLAYEVWIINMGMQFNTIEPCFFSEFSGNMEILTFDKESFNNKKVSKRENGQENKLSSKQLEWLIPLLHVL